MLSCTTNAARKIGDSSDGRQSPLQYPIDDTNTNDVGGDADDTDRATEALWFTWSMREREREVRGSSGSEANAPRGRRATATTTIELGPWLLAMDVCMPGCVDVY